jgi:alpha-galactosidase
MKYTLILQTKHIAKLFVYIISVSILSGCSKNKTIHIAENNLLKISIVNSDQTLWEYEVLKTGKTYRFRPPQFEIDRTIVTADLSQPRLVGVPKRLINRITEYTVEGILLAVPDITLRISFLVAETNPIVKFRYELLSSSTHKMTKTKGHDQISYFKVSFDGFKKVKEIRFSEFNDMVHSFCLSERDIEQKYFSDGISAMGPMMTGSDS